MIHQLDRFFDKHILDFAWYTKEDLVQCIIDLANDHNNIAYSIDLSENTLFVVYIKTPTLLGQRSYNIVEKGGCYKLEKRGK